MYPAAVLGTVFGIVIRVLLFSACPPSLPDQFWRDGTLSAIGSVWTHYGWATSKAYADAYKNNQGVLSHVKKKQEQRKQETEAYMSFALSLLTVGVAGGASPVPSPESSPASTTAARKPRKSQQKAAAPLIQAVTGVLSPEVASNDVFSPGGMTPEQYTTSLHEGISWNVAFLTKLLYEAKWEPKDKTSVPTTAGEKVIKLRSGGQLTADGAKQLTEAILDTSFMKELPPLDIDIKTLTRKASLALWIGWAQARDAKYWNKRTRPS
jgi:hypothetical protein